MTHYSEFIKQSELNM